MMSNAQALDYHEIHPQANDLGHPDRQPVEGSRSISADLALWWDLLASLGISPEQAGIIDERARLIDSSVAEEVIASGLVDETAFYLAFARELGLAVLAQLDPLEMKLTPDEALGRLKGDYHAQPVQCSGKDERITYVISPEPKDMLAFRMLVEERPDIWRGVVLAPRQAMRRALIAVAQPLLITAGRDQLFLTRPDMSARIVSNGWQGAMFATLVIGIPLGWWLAPTSTNIALHMIATVFFFGCIAIRLAASFFRKANRPSMPKPELSATPVYTILIALYDEADVVPELLVSIGRIIWPRSRLEVKLICEADDHKTIGAIRAQKLRPCIELITVPPGMPRTKPNALSYTLPLARGEFVVLYDAEDRPHLSQLIEAWRRFQVSEPELACLQAPLNVTGPAGLIPRMFAFEYAGLFRRLVPYLGRSHGFLPLGGTSNHFRREALDAVGAWDPYNVTEDADLCIRLARHGYKIDAIGLATDEDAPDTLLVWLRQRTRWLKGWALTWLVHMRNPRALVREVGLRPFLLIQIMFLGVIVSCLSHPFMLLWLGWLLGKLAMFETLSPVEVGLVWLDLYNLVFGYAAFILIGYMAQPRGRTGMWQVVLFTPVYWLMLSVAAWRAIIQLYFEPHRWEKTPHKPHHRPGSLQIRKTGQDNRKPVPDPMMAGSSFPTTAKSRSL